MPGDENDLKDLQAAALLAASGVILGFVVYWWGEIQSVIELLELAYG